MLIGILLACIIVGADSSRQGKDARVDGRSLIGGNRNRHGSTKTTNILRNIVRDIEEDPSNICKAVFCGRGRECVLQEQGQPACICRRKCTTHKHPVCGSDDVTYQNHCEMHRAACIKGIKIHKKNNGSCKAVPKKDVEKQKNKPLVCYQIERDQLRQLLIEWLKNKVEEDGWFLKGKTYSEVITESFSSCDKDHDGKLNAQEFIDCVEKNETRSEAGTTPHILRSLCVDALIVMSDQDADWQLNTEEFKHCLDPEYKPPKKQCSLEDRVYDDGAQARVRCNLCVCACGNWVCTAITCNEKQRDIKAFEQYDVRQGPLPTKEERKALLAGFRASQEVSLALIEKEVPAAKTQVLPGVKLANPLAGDRRPHQQGRLQRHNARQRRDSVEERRLHG